MTGVPQEGRVPFAVLLQRWRREAGLTQAQLAARAGVSERAVRDHEHGRSRPQHHTAALLATALGLTAARRVEFLDAARRAVAADPAGATVDGGGAAPPPARGAVAPVRRGARPGRGPGIPLPPAVPLIGRAADLAQLAARVDEPAAGPLALVGMAGAGKTVLALALAHRVADRFPGGVGGVVVTEGYTAADILAVVAAVFGVARPADLAARLAGSGALLLLDAAERSPEAVRAAIAELPGSLRVVVTGRSPVGCPGERVWPVGPLELPPADAGQRTDPLPDALDELRRYPATALLLDRLARVRSEPLAADEVPALVGLARRLGGLPLAVELAAAHGRLLRLPEILQRYGDRVLDLGGGAESSLRDAVAGSCRLLTTVEQLALRRLATFRNRWSVALAEELLADTPAAGDPVPLLDRLVSLGLAGVRGSREHRFRLVDVVRDFAAERAEAAGELLANRRAHAAVITRMASRTAPELAGPGLPDAVARLDDLAGDVWAALSHAANDDPHTALTLASKLPRWWRFRGRDAVGRRWLRRLLDDPRTADADPGVRAWAQLGAAQLAHEHGAGSEELAGAEAALAEFCRSGDVTGELAARSVLSALWMAGGGYDQAREHALASLTVALRHGRLRDATVAQHNLTWHEIRAADLDAARRRLVAADRLAAQCGERRLRVLAAANLAEVARLEERYDEAIVTGRRVLARLGELGDPGHRRRVLGTVGLALAQSGRTDEAVEVQGILRAESPADGAVDGVSAAIAANLAVARGDPGAAAAWFAVAARAHQGGPDPRDVLEALVGLAVTTADPGTRQRALAELDRVCRDGAFALVPRERAALQLAALAWAARSQ